MEYNGIYTWETENIQKEHFTGYCCDCIECGMGTSMWRRVGATLRLWRLRVDEG